MESTHQSQLQLATILDRDEIIHIITKAFENDPCFLWIREPSKRKDSIRVLSRYVVDETLSRGKIYVTPDRKAAALWHTEEKDLFNWHRISRDFNFIKDIGVKTVIRSLRMLSVKDRYLPKGTPYLYLACIGVLPEHQGKGNATLLTRSMLSYAKANQLSVFLETANANNVQIYKKVGFTVTDITRLGNINLWFMKIDNCL